MSLFVGRARIPGVCCCVLLLAVGAELAKAQSPRGAQMAASAPTAMPAGNPERGGLIAKAACAACHGLDGNSPSAQIPKLAGQNPAYLYQRLRAFRAVARPSPMTAIVAKLSDREMADTASYFALQALRPDQPEHAGRSALGRSIFLSGIPGRLPACADCHRPAAAGGAPPGMGGMMGGMRGGMMGGMMGGGRMQSATASPVPILAGQHAPYLVSQLNLFADGTLPSAVMDSIAARMSQSDRRAVAAYLSAASP